MRWNANSVPACVDARIVSDLLAAQIEALATELVGSPPSYRSFSELRFYPKGGLVIMLVGPKRGLWCHHGDGGKGGDALDLVLHLRQCSLGEAIRWARSWLGTSDGTTFEAGSRSRALIKPRAEVYKANLALEIWENAGPAKNTLVERYLEGRGLRLPPEAPLRFHPKCPRGCEKLPAMVALMTDPITARPCGVHRTYLTPDGSGKALGGAKMMLGRAGVIRLVPDDDVTHGLGLTEGIETALAIMLHVEWNPVWACGSAGAIARFPIVTGIEHLTIFADSDDNGAGLDAARLCAARWANGETEATIQIPPSGKDWADVTQEQLA